MTIAIALLLLQIDVAQPRAELMKDPAILAFSRMLVRKARTERFGEQGAFVVRTKDGTLYFVMWPPSSEKDLLRWYGRYPEGTIAIVHTHEPWLAEASKIDMRAARTTRMPVYVLTPLAIAKTTGEPSSVVMSGDWLR